MVKPCFFIHPVTSAESRHIVAANPPALWWACCAFGPVEDVARDYLRLLGDVSKPILLYLGGMNIHLPVIWGSLGYQGFDSYPLVLPSGNHRTRWPMTFHLYCR